MTILVGVMCKDGVVIGTDSSATFDNGQIRTIEQPTKKIDILDENIIVAGTGSVGLGQRFTHIVRETWNKKEFVENHLEVGKKLAVKAITDFQSTGATLQSYGALVAYSYKEKIHLCEFPAGTFQPEFKEANRLWYVSMGCGQHIADPFLGFIRNVFWQQEAPTCQEAVLAVNWTLTHTIQVNPGGINEPINIAVLKKEKTNFKARYISTEELAEHNQHVSEMEDLLRDHCKKMFNGQSETNLPV